MVGVIPTESVGVRELVNLCATEGYFIAGGFSWTSIVSAAPIYQSSTAASYFTSTLAFYCRLLAIYCKYLAKQFFHFTPESRVTRLGHVAFLPHFKHSGSSMLTTGIL